MKYTIISAVIILLGAFLISGCESATTIDEQVSVLPEPAVAKEEAKKCTAGVADTAGDRSEFRVYSGEHATQIIYEMALAENGELKPAVIRKLRSFAPKVVNALNEAQFIEPRIEGNNVVFEYDDIHNSGGFFKDEKIYLTRSNGRWCISTAECWMK